MRLWVVKFGSEWWYGSAVIAAETEDAARAVAADLEDRDPEEMVVRRVEGVEAGGDTRVIHWEETR